MAETEDSGVMSLTVTLLSAYFANNTVPSAELPALVEGTRRALLGDAPGATSVAASVTDEAVPATPGTAPEHKPKVAIEESLASPDHILSLIDGKPYKALKRHLAAHGLTPAEYRTRYSLPADYPIVAQGYSAARREVALKLGLGGKRKSSSASGAEEVPASPVAQAPEPVVADTPPAKAASARRPRAKTGDVKPKPVARTPKRNASPGPVASDQPAPPVADAPGPAVADTPPAETARDGFSSNAVEVKPAAAAAKSKRKASNGATAKAPATKANAAPKPKRIRTKKTDAEPAPSAEPAPESTPSAS
ncbi:MucR family transcriptional regulator [Sphingomonas sp. AP4-R1]|uniref:MucR family transcriptional regulator n=1 Tax=Sphingomonas sp. AP4-R1 TaxID=2735134 RepID=UPI00149357B1|nr:MucR family transcriptional regulator [Sphingomonas sp. AP4-R1]QJU58453.1 MucR family transcriptional regulator [Sphingomonas sp. AP4-R1]